jgi:hypothetical protein
MVNDRLRLVRALWAPTDLASARATSAPGTAFAVPGGGFLEVDAFQIREGSQPGEHVAELVGQVLAIAGPERPGKLADLFGEPPERSITSARGVTLGVSGAHGLL